MALEGTLEDFSLADIFQLIGIQRKSGLLTLKNSDETVTVKFHNGMVIGADSHPKKIEDRLGKVMVKTGLISPEQLKEVLEQQQKTLQKIGFILVDQKFITREQLQEALHIQVSQVIYRLFRWGRGEYYFDQKARVDPDSDDSIPPLSAESILMEGIQMIDEWPLIQKSIPNFEMVFRPVVQMEDLDLTDETDEDRMFGALTEAGVEAEKIRLSREESEVFRLLDGKNSVADVIESTRLGEFHSCKALYDLLDRKIIEPVPVSRKVSTAPGLGLADVLPPVKAKRALNLRVALPILAVVIAFPIVMGISDPLRVTALHFFKPSDSADLNASVNMTRLNQLDSAILLFFYTEGRLPESLEELVVGKYLQHTDTLDPWSRPYIYQPAGENYVLSGYTKDGKVDETGGLKRTMVSEETTTGESDTALELKP